MGDRYEVRRYYDDHGPSWEIIDRAAANRMVAVCYWGDDATLLSALLNGSELDAAHDRIDAMSEAIMECPVCNHDLRIDTERDPVGLKIGRRS